VAKRYDAAIKHLVEAHPADWLAFAGLPPATQLKVIDADISTVGPAADKVIQVLAPEPYLAHLEFQSSADAELDNRVLLYNVLLRWRHKLPVRSVVVLLRPQADGRGSSGVVNEVAASDSMLDFRYRVIRLWKQPVESVLAGGLGTLPLAPISEVAREALPDLIESIKRRLESEAEPRELTDALAATFILLGLRYPREFAQALLKGVREMKESTTYQMIIEEGEAKGRAEGMVRGIAEGIAAGIVEGRIKEARALVLRLGQRRFGRAPEKVIEYLDSIVELGELESIAEQLVEAQGWDDLIAG